MNTNEKGWLISLYSSSSWLENDLSRWSIIAYVGWVYAVKMFSDEIYLLANKIVAVLDNLNTHSPISIYETFEPEKARHLANRFEFHHIPRHGSWFNMVEIELGILITTELSY